MKLDFEYMDVAHRKGPFKFVRWRLSCTEEELVRIQELGLAARVLLEWELYDEARRGGPDFYLNRAAIKPNLFTAALSPWPKGWIDVSDLLGSGFVFGRDTLAEIKPFEDELVANVKALKGLLSETETGASRSMEI